MLISLSAATNSFDPGARPSVMPKLNPKSFMYLTRTPHMIHTENASSSAGIEHHRFRLATFEPVALQKASSSTFQSLILLDIPNSSIRSDPGRPTG